MQIQEINAVTLAVKDMAHSVQFYQAAGFTLRYGGSDTDFTSFVAGTGYLNLTTATDREPAWWGRVIFHVEDVDDAYRHVRSNGLAPEAPPRDAEWGERYFHLQDPDGHELSFARLL